MRIVVLDPAGLHHHKSGFHAWEPGQEYDFPLSATNIGWLEGQRDRGAVRLLDVLPADEEDKSGSGEGNEHSDEVPLLAVGQAVLYTAKSGAKSEKTIKAINADGTYDLGGAVLKKVERDSLAPAEPKPEPAPGDPADEGNKDAAE